MKDENSWKHEAKQKAGPDAEGPPSRMLEDDLQEGVGHMWHQLTCFVKKSEVLFRYQSVSPKKIIHPENTSLGDCQLQRLLQECFPVLGEILDSQEGPEPCVFVSRM